MSSSFDLACLVALTQGGSFTISEEAQLFYQSNDWELTSEKRPAHMDTLFTVKRKECHEEIKLKRKVIGLVKEEA